MGGSFKPAACSIACWPIRARRRRHHIASGGNASIAVAAAARPWACAAVFVPEDSPEVNAPGCAPWGPGGGDRHRVCRAFRACVARQQATGALQAHACDQPEVVAGAGTLALEIEEQGGRLPDSLLVSVGGGGLIGSVAAWVDSRAHVVALEPEACAHPACRRAAGMPVDVEGRQPGPPIRWCAPHRAIGWRWSQRHVHASLLLPDDAIHCRATVAVGVQAGRGTCRSPRSLPCRPAPTARSHVKPWR